MARRPALDRGPQAGGEYQFVRNGEVKIAYQVLGEGGPPVLFLQPFWLSSEDVRVPGETFGPLLFDSYRTIVHDRRGTGASDRHPGLVDTCVQAQDLATVLDAAEINRVLVVAMTEAAPLAVHFAAEYPDRIARIVLIDPQLRPRIGQGSTMLLHTLHSRPRVGLRAFARSLTDDDEAADALADRMANRLDAPTAARLFESFLNAGALDVVPAVAARTLLAFGVYEKMVIEEEALDLQSLFADAQLGLVQGMPGTPAAAREAWIELRDFLAAAPRTGPDEPLNQRRPSVMPVTMPRRNAGVQDYVPAAPDMQRIPISATLSPEALGPARTRGGRWVPAAIRHVEVPKAAIELNRKAIDLILLGEIEQALALFQQAMDLAPHYEDAAVNYRELLSRLVQRRVAQWQNEQAEHVAGSAARRSEAKKSRRLFGLLKRAA